jgi:1,4-dihydroxy-2-naphthoate polyprenyltransferase
MMILKFPPFSWFDESSVKHLRFSFSFFLSPVFLFALSQASEINYSTAILGFVILHLLVFPSSNGYNSYQDRDETSIGGLRKPPKVTTNLFYVTLLMDLLALLGGFFISVFFSLMVLLFIFMSRAYSYRPIRLKKYPYIGFITVFVFQGGFVYLMSMAAINNNYQSHLITTSSIICMSISSLFIGSIYPLTQIYQHEADKKDGVLSISYKLGYTGTFVFSGVLFTIAVLLLFEYFSMKHQLKAMILFLVLMLPVIYKLSVWFVRVRKDTSQADFENTMNMNLLTSVCMNIFFVLLIMNRYGNWF